MKQPLNEDQMSEVDRALTQWHKDCDNLYEEMVWDLSIRLGIEEDKIKEHL